MDRILPYSSTSRPPERNRWLTYAMNIKPRQRSKSVDPVTAWQKSEGNFDDNHNYKHQSRSQFYENLYKRYPKAFQRKNSETSLSSRSSVFMRPSRKLFNSDSYDPFEDDRDGSICSDVKPSLTRRNVQGKYHYPDCLTSPTPSVISDFSVKHRLHSTSDKLHSLVQGKSLYPRNRSFQDDPISEPFSPRNIMLDNMSGDDEIAILEQELEWKEKQLNKYRRKLEYDTSVLNANSSVNTHYETLNWIQESPPDSAIDIDTFSLQSQVSMDTISVLANEINIDDGHNFQNLDDENCRELTCLPDVQADLHVPDSRELENVVLYNDGVPKQSDITLTHKDSDVDSGIVQSARGYMRMLEMELDTSHLDHVDDLPVPYRPSDDTDIQGGYKYQSENMDQTRSIKHQTPKPKPLKADHSLQILIPNIDNNEDDDDIRQELLNAQISRDIGKFPQFNTSGSSLLEDSDDVDDSDPRLGIPEVKGNEQEIAAQYQRRRSPSPYLLGKTKFSIKNRPQSAPLFGMKNKMQYVNISPKHGDGFVGHLTPNGEKGIELEQKETFQGEDKYRQSGLSENAYQIDDQFTINFESEEGRIKRPTKEDHVIGHLSNSRTSSLSSNSTLSDTSCNSMVSSQPQQMTHKSVNNFVIDNEITPSLPDLSNETQLTFQENERHSQSQFLVLREGENFEQNSRSNQDLPFDSSNENRSKYFDKVEDSVVMDSSGEIVSKKERNLGYDICEYSGKETKTSHQDEMNNEQVDLETFVEGQGQVEQSDNQFYTNDINDKVQYNRVHNEYTGSVPDLLGSVQSECTEKDSAKSRKPFENVIDKENDLKFSPGSDESDESVDDVGFVKLTPFEYVSVVPNGNRNHDKMGDVTLNPYEAAINLNQNGVNVEEIIDSDSDNIFSAKRIVLNKPKKQKSKDQGHKVHHVKIERSDDEYCQGDRSESSSNEAQNLDRIVTCNTNTEIESESKCEKIPVKSDATELVDDHMTSNVTNELPNKSEKSDHMTGHVTVEQPMKSSKSSNFAVKKLPANPSAIDQRSNPGRHDFKNIDSKMDDLIVPVDVNEDGSPQRENNSNLTKTKALSASKQSLSDKMGSLKKSAKGKFKAIRKAVSMDRGLNKASFEPELSTSPPAATKVKMPKMKKALSLKNIFSKKKSKHGSTEFLDHMSPYAATTSVHSAEDVYAVQSSSQGIDPSHQFRPIGKLRQFCPDGTQVIELNKPPHGPLGIYIARGNQHFKHGIFISRFSEPEKTFAGVVSVGDEILEVNGKSVKNLTLDEVYETMAAKTCLIMKILPLLARKDV